MIWFCHLISRLSLGLLQSCWSCGHVCGGINKKGHKTKSFIPKSCKNRFKDLDDIWNILISSPTLYFPYCITFSLLSCTSPRFFLVISCGNVGTERNEHKDAPWDKLETTQFFLETLIVLTTPHKPVKVKSNSAADSNVQVPSHTGRRVVR